MLTIHIRINDEHGQATPVRLQINDAEGTHYPPFGYQDVIPGACEVPLPAGVPLRIQASKGIEYLPIDTTVTLKPGQMAVRLQLERWIDPGETGWVAGDIRCQNLTPHDAALQGAADGLRFVNLLIDDATMGQPNTLSAFSGQDVAVQLGSTSVIVNSLNRALFDKVALLASHRPILPLTMRGPYAIDDWHLADWCDQCHRKNGLTVCVEPSIDAITHAMVAMLLGKIDALELGLIGSPFALQLLYQLLNLGLDIAPVGGSATTAPHNGSLRYRTMAQVPETQANDYHAWIDAIRSRRCYVTSGSLLGANNLWRSWVEFDRLERVIDGKVVEAVSPHRHKDIWQAQLPDFEPTHGRWSAMRLLSAEGNLLAHTAATVHDPNHKPMIEGTHLIDRLQATRRWIENDGHFNNPKRRDEMLQSCVEAMRGLGFPA